MLIVFGVAVVGVLVEAFLPRQSRYAAQVVLSLGGLVAAFVAVVVLARDLHGAVGRTAVLGAVVVDAPALFLQGTILLVGILGILLIAERRIPAPAEPDDASGGLDAFTPQASAVAGSVAEQLATRAGVVQTEVFPLTLFAVGGMLLFPASDDLLTMFIALEVLSLPLYLLCGLARRRRLLSQEAALKYFLLGAFSSAFFLYGVAMLYGYAGTLDLGGIAEAVAAGSGNDVAGADRHRAAAGGRAVQDRCGAVPLLDPRRLPGRAHTDHRVHGRRHQDGRVRRDAARLLRRAARTARRLAARAVGGGDPDHGGRHGHGGDPDRRETDAGVFGGGALRVHPDRRNRRERGGTVLDVVLSLRLRIQHARRLRRCGAGPDATGDEDTAMSRWAGLGRRYPLVGVVFSLFLLAFAGIPLTSGFVSKFAVFKAAGEGGAIPLVIVGVVASAVAAYFYVRVIVLMFFTDPPDAAPVVVVPSVLSTATVTVTAAVTFALGALPQPLLDLVNNADQFLR